MPADAAVAVLGSEWRLEPEAPPRIPATNRFHAENLGTTHTSLGQEANAVGVINALDRSRDTVWSNHRCHGHFLAYCGQVAQLLGEITGRREGVCGGRGGSQHLSRGRFHSSGLQGGPVPLAPGTALADRADHAISVVFLGDGTMGQGVVYEGLNLNTDVPDCSEILGDGRRRRLPA